MKSKIFIIILLLITLTGCCKREQGEQLNVLNWSSYIPDSVINNFEKEYKIKVNYGTYSSNEELLAKVSSSKTGTYDLIFPSDYMVELMKQRDIIQKIDVSKINNKSNISDIFLRQYYDSDNSYTLPFLTTSVVIAVNKNNISENIISYNDLLNEKYKNDIVLIDDQRIIIGMSLQALGYDMNETNTNKLKEAKNWLLKLKKNIKAYDSDSPKTFLITEEANIGILWHAEALLAKEINPNIEIIYPKEGHALSSDNYAILKGAKNVDNAYKFINYLLRTDISTKIVKEYPYISPNMWSNDMSKDEIKEILNTGTYVKNIGPKIKEYDKLWAEIK